MRQINRHVLIVGVALFAMFFGAGNLIFPPYMGLLAGVDWKWALLGFLITGIGMPLLGIMAAARAGGTIEHMGSRVSPWFGLILSIVVILAIGPLLAIPRTCATAFELGVRSHWPGFPASVFSVIFFGITLWFSMNRSEVVDKIGKFLTPFLVITLAWIILKGILTPLGPIDGAGIPGPTGRGFREGYQTMDALASLVFAQIIIGALVYKGYTNTKDQIRMASMAGGIAVAGLGIVYGGLMYLGATAGSLFTPDVERTDLLAAIAYGIMGGTGKLTLGLAVSLACLTTAIGLTATVAEYFSRLSGGRLGYRLIAVATVTFSGIFATVGVTTIVNVAYPLLVTVYPVAIVLIVLTLAGVPASIRAVAPGTLSAGVSSPEPGNLPNQQLSTDASTTESGNQTNQPLPVGTSSPATGTRSYQAVYIGAVTGALITSIPEALGIIGLPIGFLNTAIETIPFAKAGFAWILPSAAGALAGFAVSYFKGQSE